MCPKNGIPHHFQSSSVGLPVKRYPSVRSWLLGIRMTGGWSQNLRLFRLELHSKVKRNSWCQLQSYQRGNTIHFLRKTCTFSMPLAWQEPMLLMFAATNTEPFIIQRVLLKCSHHRLRTGAIRAKEMKNICWK